MPCKKLKLDNATIMIDNHRTPLTRSKCKPVNEKSMDSKHDVNMAFMKNGNYFEETLLRRSKRKSVNEESKNLKSKSDIIKSKIEKVMIKKSKTGDKTFYPKLIKTFSSSTDIDITPEPNLKTNSYSSSKMLTETNFLSMEDCKVRETSLRRSRRKQVDEKTMDPKIKVNQTNSMCEQEHVIKTPIVLIKKLEVTDKIASPNLGQNSPDSGICSELSFKEESYLSVLPITPIKTGNLIFEDHTIREVGDYNQIESTPLRRPRHKRVDKKMSKIHMLKTPRVLVKKLKVLDKTSYPEFETCSLDSADSGISSGLSLKNESCSLFTMSETPKETNFLPVENCNKIQKMPLRRSQRKLVIEKNIEQMSKMQMNKAPRVFIQNSITEEKTSSSEFKQSSLIYETNFALSSKDENSCIASTSKPKESKFLFVKKSESLTNGKQELNDRGEISDSSYENIKPVSKEKVTSKEIFETQNENESEPLSQPTKKELFLGEKRSPALFENNIATSSSTKEGSVLQVLAQHEFDAVSECQLLSSKKFKTKISSDDSSSESDWEEVEEKKELSLEDYKPVIPKNGVEITIDCPELNIHKRRTNRFDRKMDYIRRLINRGRMEHQLNIQKTHLLCLLAHGLFGNDILNSDNLKAFALSYLPSEFLALTAGRKIEKANSKVIRHICTWFWDTFSFENKRLPFVNFQKIMPDYFQEKKSLSPSEYNLMFIVFARTLGFKTRFCVSFYPVDHKAKNLLKKSASKRKNNYLNETDSEDEQYSKKVKSMHTIQTKSKNRSKTRKNKKVKLDSEMKKNKSRPKRQVTKKNYKISSDEDEENKRYGYKMSSDEDDVSDKDYVCEISSDEDEVEDYVDKFSSDEDEVEDYVDKFCSDQDEARNKNFVSKISSKKDEVESKKNIKATSKCKRPFKKLSGKSADHNNIDKNEVENNDCFEKSSGLMEPIKRSSLLKKSSECNRKMICDKDEVKDRDCVEKASKSIKQVKRAMKKSSNISSDCKVLSRDTEPVSPENLNFRTHKIICWCEVYSKPDRQWISIECTKKIIDKPYHIEELLPQPVAYILAYDNDSYIKDVTKRYCHEYMTSSVKLRADPDWWEKTLVCFAPPNSKLNEEEEKKLDEMLVKKPLPKTVGEYKNHPLYALQRHLLKYEAIYPSDAAPVGFLREEPIYARDNVCKLYSRESWIKEGRTVRVNEEPYKFVKAPPRWDRINRRINTNLPPLGVFGFWQTEPYEPPAAKDGKVPRNEYGNVELFKPWMLPKGTVHLKLPGLNRIAKKLDIDCSKAFFGFDRSKATFCPIFDGFVVCEEFKDTLVAAWEEEQMNARKREEEKREKQIYDSWKKLIKGLLIRERIKLKYDVK